MVEGHLQPPVRLTFEVKEGKPAPLDCQAARDYTTALGPERLPLREREETLALLARWFYSSWRDGEWLDWESSAGVPYRKLVHAISRVASARGSENAGKRVHDAASRNNFFACCFPYPFPAFLSPLLRILADGNDHGVEEVRERIAMLAIG